MPSAERLMETPESRFVGLFIGRSKGGKSTAAYSFPKPMKILDLDGRIRGGLSNPWIDPKGIDYETYPPRAPVATYIKLDKDLDTLLQAQNMANFGGMTPYKTLVLDSITFEAISLLADANKLTEKGKMIGQFKMVGPAEYGFQSQVIWNTMSFLKSLQIPNIIVTAHLVNKFGKPPGDKNEYAENVIVGEQLALTDKLAEAIPAVFDHIYRFSKNENGQRSQFWVKTDGEMESSAFIGLPREEDITGKDFYKWMMGKVQKPLEAKITFP